MRGLRRPVSPREAQALDLLAAGRSNREIAAALGLTEGTVKKMIYRALWRQELPNRTALAVWWLKLGDTPEGARIDTHCPRCGSALRVVLALR